MNKLTKLLSVLTSGEKRTATGKKNVLVSLFNSKKGFGAHIG